VHKCFSFSSEIGSWNINLKKDTQYGQGRRGEGKKRGGGEWLQGGGGSSKRRMTEMGLK